MQWHSGAVSQWHSGGWESYCYERIDNKKPQNDLPNSASQKGNKEVHYKRGVKATEDNEYYTTFTTTPPTEMSTTRKPFAVLKDTASRNKNRKVLQTSIGPGVSLEVLSSCPYSFLCFAQMSNPDINKSLETQLIKCVHFSHFFAEQTLFAAYFFLFPV